MADQEPLPATGEEPLPAPDQDITTTQTWKHLKDGAFTSPVETVMLSNIATMGQQNRQILMTQAEHSLALKEVKADLKLVLKALNVKSAGSSAASSRRSSFASSSRRSSIAGAQDDAEDEDAAGDEPKDADASKAARDTLLDTHKDILYEFFGSFKGKKYVTRSAKAWSSMRDFFVYFRSRLGTRAEHKNMPELVDQLTADDKLEVYNHCAVREANAKKLVAKQKKEAAKKKKDDAREATDAILEKSGQPATDASADAAESSAAGADAGTAKSGGQRRMTRQSSRSSNVGPDSQESQTQSPAARAKRHGQSVRFGKTNTKDKTDRKGKGKAKELSFVVEDDEVEEEENEDDLLEDNDDDDE